MVSSLIDHSKHFTVEVTFAQPFYTQQLFYHTSYIQGQFTVKCLGQGHFGKWTGGAGDRIIDLLVSGPSTSAYGATPVLLEYLLVDLCCRCMM